MAHQMNLVVGDIFKESLQYKQVSKDAVRIVSYFHSSPYFTGLLRNEQMSCYGQTIALITPGETRWNSYYFCFHSVLKTEAALKVRKKLVLFYIFNIKFYKFIINTYL
jgi:3-hydroxymyristoyl/3-hydroxydecanoyl-(acyl carrier protein) dehydratase